MFCTTCGKKIKDGVKFCPYCGSPTGEAAQLMAEAATTQDAPAALSASAAPEAPADLAGQIGRARAKSRRKLPPVLFIVLVVLALAATAFAATLAYKFVIEPAMAPSAPTIVESESPQHLIPVRNSVPGLDTSTGTKIPLRITGRDAAGKKVDARAYADDAGIELPEGSYTVTVPASPIAADGTIYATDGAEAKAKVGSDGLDAGSLTIKLDAVDAKAVTDDQINAAYEAAKDGGAPSKKKADELKAAATKKRDDAVAAQKRADEEAAAKKKAEEEAAAKKAAEEAAAAKQAKIDDAKNRGMNVLEGTIRVYANQEALWQGTRGMSDPNHTASLPYVQDTPVTVLALPQETSVRAYSYNQAGMVSESTKYIVMPDSFAQYDGKTVGVALDPNKVAIADDVRAVGMGADEAELLYVS